MDFEDLIVVLIVGLALLWQAVAWLKEQLEKPQKRPASITMTKSATNPHPEFAAFEKRFIESSVPPRGTTTAAAISPSAAERGRMLRQQLGLDRRSALRRSIILMTILGPCRANEREMGNDRSRG